MEQKITIGLVTGSVAGITGSILIGAMAGAIVGLCVSKVSLQDRILSAIAGLAIGLAGAQPLSDFLELEGKLTGGVALLLALFGVPIVLEMRAIIADGSLREFITRFLIRKGGGEK